MEAEQVWEVVAGALAVAGALLVVGTVVQAVGFGPFGNVRGRLEVAAQGANPVDALFALLAVALVYARSGPNLSGHPGRRWIVWVATGVAGLVAIGALYSIWDVLTISFVRRSGPPFARAGWASRIAAVSGPLATLVAAGVAILLGSRPRALMSRSTRQGEPF